MNEITPYRLLFPTIELIVPVGTFLVGREQKSCDVIIRRDSVSRVHCLLTATPTSLQIRDLQSQNGVFVNGKRVQKTDLREDDRIRVGTARFSIVCDQESVEGDPSSAPPSVRRAKRTARRPSVGDLSRDSIEIPAGSIEEDDFDHVLDSDGELSAVASEDAANTLAMNSAALKKAVTRDQKERPVPLQRTKLPEVAPESEGITGDESAESEPSPDRVMSTTTGKLALVLIVGWALYLTLSLLTGGRGRDREIAQRLVEIGEEVRSLREQSAPQDAWDRREAELDSELKSMIKYLEKNASSDDPARQHLLRAARDCLPRMFGVSTEPSWYEERYHEYLKAARQELKME